jgi:hypothetical protein
LQIPAQLCHPAAVGHLGGREDGKRRQPGSHVAAHVELGSSFPLPVFRPVDGLERQLQDRCIHREYAPEAETGKAALWGG